MSRLVLPSEQIQPRSHGYCRKCLVVGEPDIGKSRLIEEFRARLGETPHTWVEWWSSQRRFSASRAVFSLTTLPTSG